MYIYIYIYIYIGLDQGLGQQMRDLGRWACVRRPHGSTTFSVRPFAEQVADAHDCASARDKVLAARHRLRRVRRRTSRSTDEAMYGCVDGCMDGYGCVRGLVDRSIHYFFALPPSGRPPLATAPLGSPEVLEPPAPAQRAARREEVREGDGAQSALHAAPRQ